MAGHEPDDRVVFELSPVGNPVRAGMMGTLAQSGGVLVGAIVDGSVRTWLSDANGQLTLVMWPANYRARFDPLEIIDERGDVVAFGGDRVTVAGGFLKPDDPPSHGHAHVFSAWQVSRSSEQTP